MNVLFCYIGLLITLSLCIGYIIGFITCIAYMLTFNHKYHYKISFNDIPFVFIASLAGPIWIWALIDLIREKK